MSVNDKVKKGNYKSIVLYGEKSGKRKDEKRDRGGGPFLTEKEQ